LASSVISMSPRGGNRARARAITAATASGAISEGVPPPKKIEASRRGPVRAAWASMSVRMASTSAACSSPRPRSRTTLKSQYGQIRAQYGQWT
jgi:hypothetical protein